MMSLWWSRCAMRRPDSCPWSSMFRECSGCGKSREPDERHDRVIALIHFEIEHESELGNLSNRLTMKPRNLTFAKMERSGGSQNLFGG